MAEAYKINSSTCVFMPTSTSPTKIAMPVTPQGSVATPVSLINALSVSQNSWEFDAASTPYSDIYFNSSQFSTLVNNIKNNVVTYVTYDAPSIAGNDAITKQKVTTNYP
jgi:hypothetical protein